MDLAAVWVTLGGVALAIGVNAYFFGPRKAAIAQPSPAGAAVPVDAPADAPADATGGAPGDSPAAEGPQEV